MQFWHSFLGFEDDDLGRSDFPAENEIEVGCDDTLKSF